MASKPRSVEEIFKDYSARRIAIIRALTHGTYYSSLSLAFHPCFHFSCILFFFSQMLINYTGSVIQERRICASMDIRIRHRK
ncbi:hypothetical protein GLYMA_06G288150v4 [Glycine max]|nr:hypothetical protein GLYMA_06G288150v4 [Glycine max]